MRILLIITLFFTALNCFAQSGALVWSEEFNNESVNPDIWNYETGTGINGNWGTGQMDIATDRSENVRIQQGVPEADGGVLVITTRRETFSLPGQGTRDYTSGRIYKQKSCLGAGSPDCRQGLGEGCPIPGARVCILDDAGGDSYWLQ
jgi:hypothetical protein